MRKIFQLNSCNTCQRILKEWEPDTSFEIQNIKEKNISEEELDNLKEIVGSYEAMFSRRAMKFRQWGLHEKELTEQDYRELILKEYTFMKRPIAVCENRVFVGNAKKSVNSAKEVFDELRK